MAEHPKEMRKLHVYALGKGRLELKCRKTARLLFRHNTNNFIAFYRGYMVFIHIPAQVQYIIKDRELFYIS